MRRILLLFDCDGTITSCGHDVTRDMLHFLRQLRGQHLRNSTDPSGYADPVLVETAVMGGLMLYKMKQRIGTTVLTDFDYVFPENGTSVFHDGRLERKLSIRDHLGPSSDNVIDTIVQIVLECQLEHKLPFVRGTFIDYRTGVINVSPAGRHLTLEERRRFHDYDREHNVRIHLVEKLRKRLPHTLDLDILIGGAVGVDIVPAGWDKRLCLAHVRSLNRYDEIHVFGDKWQPGENDTPILDAVEALSAVRNASESCDVVLGFAHRVQGPSHTVSILSDLFDDVGCLVKDLNNFPATAAVDDTALNSEKTPEALATETPLHKATMEGDSNSNSVCVLVDTVGTLCCPYTGVVSTDIIDALCELRELGVDLAVVDANRLEKLITRMRIGDDGVGSCACSTHTSTLNGFIDGSCGSMSQTTTTAASITSMCDSSGCPQVLDVFRQFDVVFASNGREAFVRGERMANTDVDADIVTTLGEDKLTDVTRWALEYIITEKIDLDDDTAGVTFQNADALPPQREQQQRQQQRQRLLPPKHGALVDFRASSVVYSPCGRHASGDMRRSFAAADRDNAVRANMASRFNEKFNHLGVECRVSDVLGVDVVPTGRGKEMCVKKLTNLGYKQVFVLADQCEHPHDADFNLIHGPHDTNGTDSDIVGWPVKGGPAETTLFLRALICMARRRTRSGQALQRTMAAPTASILPESCLRLTVGHLLKDKQLKQWGLPFFHRWSSWMDNVCLHTMYGKRGVDAFDVDVVIHKVVSLYRPDVVMEADPTAVDTRRLKKWLRDLDDGDGGDGDGDGGDGDGTGVIDSIQAVSRVSSREVLFQLLCEEESLQSLGVSVPAHVVVTQPPLRRAERHDALAQWARRLISQRGLNYPLLYKPDVADGTPESHDVRLVLDETGLFELCNHGDGVQAPFLLQEYVEHGRVIHKVYFLWPSHCSVVTRPSLGLPRQSPTEKGQGSGDPNIDTAPQQRHVLEVGRISRQDAPLMVAAAAATTSIVNANTVDGEGSAVNRSKFPHEETPPLPLDTIMPYVTALSACLGLSALGADIIVEQDTGRLFVVDVNYLPSFAGTSKEKFENSLMRLMLLKTGAATNIRRRANPTRPPPKPVT